MHGLSADPYWAGYREKGFTYSGFIATTAELTPRLVSQTSLADLELCVNSQDAYYGMWRYIYVASYVEWGTVEDDKVTTCKGVYTSVLANVCHEKKKWRQF